MVGSLKESTRLVKSLSIVSDENYIDSCECAKIKPSFTAYLKLRGYNIIVMDWSSVAKDLVYLRAAKKVSLVANRLTRLINWFIDLGIVVSDLKCIGHSLGAHVVGLGSLKAKSVIGMVAGEFSEFLGIVWRFFSPSIV